jgi:CheY-like chemotaxis protein
MADRHVLIIDDNVEFAENIQEILEDEGLKAAVAADGPTGIEKINEELPSLVITDMRMPGMNGLEVIQYIKDKWPELPVIVISAYARDELLEQAEKEGALGVLSKPVDLEYLSQFVHRVASSNERVLIVEDDDAMRTNLIDILQQIDGVIPLAVKTVKSALRMIERAHPSGAVIDLRLPDGDGLLLATKIRELEGDHFPIVFITGFVADFRSNLDRLLETPGVTLMEKPFKTSNLLEVVRSTLT